MDDLAVRIRAIADEVQALQQELARAAAAPARRHRNALAERFRSMYGRMQELLLIHPATPLPVRGGRRLYHAPRPD